MVKGLVLMRWDDRSGAEVITNYPECKNLLDEMVLFQIYGQHEYSSEAGIVSLTSGQTNLLSYYSGPIDNHYVILILDETEDPDDFESPLISYSQSVFQAKQENYELILKEIYNKIRCHMQYNQDQVLVAHLNNEYKKQLLERIRVEGVINKPELRSWLHDKYRNKFLDIDALLIELVRIGLIKISSVRGEGICSEYVFLIQDILTWRIPYHFLLNNFKEYGVPENLRDDVFNVIEDYFSQYEPSEEDTSSIINILLDDNFYKLFIELKKKSKTREELEILFDNGATEAINQMEKLSFIQWIDDREGGGFYILKTDIHIERVFPEYILNILKEKYNQKALAKEIIQEYLSILENVLCMYLNNSL
ncbi:MAG: hypothetical protein ACTSR8_04320 [Promethearchaeota archaeon]